MFMSPHTPRKAVNVALWRDADAVSRWRNQRDHLRLQIGASDGLYESLRIRLGPISDTDSKYFEVSRHLVLYYRQNVEGIPEEDVTSLIDADTASELRVNLIDSAVYQGTHTLWVSALRSKEAALQLEKALPRASARAQRLRLKLETTS